MQTYVKYTRDDNGFLTRHADIHMIESPFAVEANAEWEALQDWPEDDVYWQDDENGWAPVRGTSQ